MTAPATTLARAGEIAAIGRLWPGNHRPARGVRSDRAWIAIGSKGCGRTIVIERRRITWPKRRTFPTGSRPKWGTA